MWRLRPPSAIFFGMSRILRVEGQEKEVNLFCIARKPHHRARACVFVITKFIHPNGIYGLQTGVAFLMLNKHNNNPMGL